VVNRSWDTYCDLQQIDRIVEFQGGGRSRMMVRKRDPNDVDLVLPGTTRWTLDTPRTLRVQTRPCRAVRQGQADYDGDAPYGDFSVSFPGGAPQVDEQTAYLPGIGQIDATTGQATYVYGDHLGTARAAMVPGDPTPRYGFYTAFGEPVEGQTVTDFCDAGASPPFCPRYQYVGAHGYETGLVPDDGNYASANWLHVGHRWYDPASGRFLQRDPIGIRGGLNAYLYLVANPVIGIDPSGLETVIGDIGEYMTAAGGIVAGAGCGMVLVSMCTVGPSAGLSAPLGVAGTATAAAGGVVVGAGSALILVDKVITALSTPGTDDMQPFTLIVSPQAAYIMARTLEGEHVTNPFSGLPGGRGMETLWDWAEQCEQNQLDPHTGQPL